MQRAKDVDGYINSAPKEVQGKLKDLRELIKSAAPEAQEKISYNMPYYGYKGRLAYFSYFKNHIGLYIMPKVLKEYEEEIKGLKTGRATIRLSLDKELPAALIIRMIKTGVKKNEKTR